MNVHATVAGPSSVHLNRYNS